MRFLVCGWMILCSYFLSLPLYGFEVNDVLCPDKVLINGHSLVLNGAGMRSHLVIPFYAAALYLNAKSSDGDKIIEADELMSIRLKITSPVISNTVVEKSIIKAFHNVMGGKIEPLQSEIDSFIGLFKDSLKQGDNIDFIYLPDVGTKIIKNRKTLLIIKSLEFKKALFGIWLSHHSVQESLKNEMLGGTLENPLFN